MRKSCACDSSSRARGEISETRSKTVGARTRRKTVGDVPDAGSGSDGEGKEKRKLQRRASRINKHNIQMSVVKLISTTTKLGLTKAAAKNGGSPGSPTSGRRKSASPLNAPAASEMTADKAALMLQARFRQHKAWVNVRAIRMVREEQQRLTARGPSNRDPLGMGADGMAMPAANATRRWQPPKFSACVGVEPDASMAVEAFEEETKVEMAEGRSKLDFEYQLPAWQVRAAAEQSEKEKSGGSLFSGGSSSAGSGLGRKRKGGFDISKVWPRVRYICKKLIDHPASPIGPVGIMVLILASTVILCMDSARLRKSMDPTSMGIKDTMQSLNLFFAVVFTIEFVVKLIALGMKGYFCDGFNNLDFFCVLIAWVTMSPDGGSLGALKSLRTLRGLRPLRLATRIKSIATVMEALVRAVPAIGNVMLILLVFWLVFAILGVQVFGGTLADCRLYVPAPLSGGEVMLVPMTALTNKTVCNDMAAELNLRYDTPGGILEGLCATIPAEGSLIQRRRAAGCCGMRRRAASITSATRS